MSGQLLIPDGDYSALEQYLKEKRKTKLLLVSGKHVSKLGIGKWFLGLPERLGVEVIHFDGFSPNPKYESIEEGVQLFRKEQCDMIAAVGGGSAMDVAKCIKLYSNMDPGRCYLEQEIVPNEIPFLAVPTTAGTGSEATRFAVIYYKGEKQSVAHLSSIPTAVFFDPDLLASLPEYQKKSTMLDALCHSIESFWSVNSTKESRQLSAEAIRKVFAHVDGFLSGERSDYSGMFLASNIAGRAINITQTTAGHAMCYKLTSLFGLSHGHAAALCVRELFPHMIAHTDLCIDPRGEEYLKETLAALAETFSCSSPKEAADKLDRFVTELGMEIPKAGEEDYAVLCKSVNPVRLKNHPVRLDEEEIDRLYHKILSH